jgi:O-antigen/teichoic acid export membrane protein
VISFGILLAPLMSLTVVPLVAFGRKRRRTEDISIDLIGEEPESPVAVGTTLGGGSAFVASAFLVMLSEQALLNAGVLIVATSLDVAAAGLFFNIMLIARAPQVLFGSVTTSLLPSLSRHWVSRDRDGGAAFRREVAGTIKVVALFDLALVALVAAVGPDLMTLTFGSDHSYDRAGLIIVAAGLGFHLTALTLTQAQLARDRAAVTAACWVACAIGFVIFAALPLLPAVRQAETGYAVTAAILSLLLYFQYAGGRPWLRSPRDCTFS